VPVRDVSMGYSRCQVKHDDGAISLCSSQIRFM
jgi:hypothetical protein